jgi:hypothetical protein
LQRAFQKLGSRYKIHILTTAMKPSPT